ncbi:RuvA C-terminal domain-containing protein [Dielma fastidiosa]
MLALGYKQSEINKVLKQVSYMEYAGSDEAIRLSLNLLANRK